MRRLTGSVAVLLLFVMSLSGYPVWLSPVAAQVAEESDTIELSAPDGARIDTPTPDLAQVAQSIVQQTNQFRQQQQLPSVSEDADLTKAAQYFADYMARTDRYGHTADDQRPSERAKQHGYDFCIVLENIAYRFSSRPLEAAGLATGFTRGWIESTEHRRNMTDPDITNIGVGIARSKESGFYYGVQKFGRPKSQAISFSIANRTRQPIQYEILSRDTRRTYTLDPLVIRTHQQCRPPKLRVLNDDQSHDQVQALQPQPGDSFVFRTRSGQLEVTREATDEQRR